MYKKRYASRNIRGKLKVCQYLKENVRLQSIVPQTVSFSRGNLNRMVSQYDTLFVKPNVGSMGIGVYKLQRVEDSFKLYKIVGRRQVCHDFSNLEDIYNHLRESQTTRLIIQRGIELDQVQKRPYDIRVMVQRKPGGRWVCTGFMVKVGAQDKIVTNYYQGGKIYSISKLGKEQGLSAAQNASRIRLLTRYALRISRALSRKQSGMHELGIDFAFDTEQRLWVLEVNSNHPQFHPLKKLDRRSYYRMKRFAASYGRHDAK